MKTKVKKKAKMKNKTRYKVYGRRCFVLQSVRHIQTPLRPKETVKGRFFEIRPDGLMVAKKFCIWNGRSGMIQTEATKTPSLFHDLCYWAFRNELLDLSLRDVVDDHYQKMLIDRGVWKIRAVFDRKMLQIFGGKAASPDNRKEVLTAP